VQRRILLPLVLAVLLPTGTAHAFEPFALLVPCRATAENSVGTTRPCITCHNNADGGSGCSTPPCFNPFGTACDMNGRMWDTALAMGDADGDGYTNGQELGDPEGTWRAGMATPMTCDCATRPGFATFTPGDEDADRDLFCCIGQDVNGDGDCLDDGENDPSAGDCDEMDNTANTGAAEMCTNTIDNDCDGAATLLDDDCRDVVDRDGDGFCATGEDMNADRDCIDPGEPGSTVDCDDDQVTVNPAAGENCLDMLDNDCDGDTDRDDADCTSDTDADGDGYCPIGRDLDMNGDCNGAGEETAGFDCDDSAADVNSGQAEICDDFRDNDCDGVADFRDEADCSAFFDADGDGYCPSGRDGNGNGNCVDPGEADEPGDCDDTNPAVNPGLTEACLDDDVDEDCDGDISLADDDCAGYIDSDGDLFCFVGRDIDRDGTCVGEGEQDGDGDCDEMDPEVRPFADELCTDGVDNDCDGSTDGAERITCDEYRDIDGDGWCLAGQDIDGDGHCDDEGEQGDESEWTGEEDPHTTGGTEGNPVRYPGAPENCRNGWDDDLDGMIDEAGACTSDVDADGDGYCPLGTDMNGDGDCLDDGENGGHDCDDGDDTVNTGEMERCRMATADHDCDGDVGVADDDCFIVLDLEGDGLCGEGIDDNADGDCLDEGEDRFGVDCDEENPEINSRAREICDDGIDNDCDETIDYYDTQCECDETTSCDDGDPCTLDICNDDENCENVPDPTCGDGGMMSMADAGPDGGMTPPEDDGGCGCRAVGGGTSPAAPLALLGLGLVLWRRRRCR